MSTATSESCLGRPSLLEREHDGRKSVGRYCCCRSGRRLARASLSQSDLCRRLCRRLRRRVQLVDSEFATLQLIAIQASQPRQQRHQPTDAIGAHG